MKIHFYLKYSKQAP